MRPRHLKVNVPLFHELVSNALLVQNSATGGSKRQRSSENIVSSKKIKVDESLPLTPKAPKDVQCAFYGIERLRHSMDITHSMSVLLSGE